MALGIEKDGKGQQTKAELAALMKQCNEKPMPISMRPTLGQEPLGMLKKKIEAMKSKRLI